MLKKYASRVLLAATVYFLFHASKVGSGEAIFQFVTHDFIYLIYISAIVLTVLEVIDYQLLLLKRKGFSFIKNNGNWKVSLRLTVFVLPVVVLATFFSFYVIRPAFDCAICEGMSDDSIFKDIILGQILAWLIIAARLIEENAAEAKVLERDHALVQKELLEAKFQNLKNQVNPHFLFNSFSVLQNLIEQNPEKAAIFLDKLSEMYRYILERQDESMSTLQRELEVLHVYLYLMKTRHEDSLDIQVNIEKGAMETYIPSLSLQMLVENAIKHNRFSKAEPLRIEIFSEDDYVVVKNVLRKKGAVPKTTRVGLENIRKRYGLQTNIPVAVIDNQEVFEVRLPVLSSLKFA